MQASPAAPPSMLLPPGPVTAAEAAIEQVLNFGDVHPAVAAFDSFRVDAEHASVLEQDPALVGDVGGDVFSGLGVVPEHDVVVLPTVARSPAAAAGSSRGGDGSGWAAKPGAGLGAQARRAALKATESMYLRRAEAEAQTSGSPDQAVRCVCCACACCGGMWLPSR